MAGHAAPEAATHAAHARPAAHGGGMPWLPGTYDPELNLYYVGTGNANPVLSGASRKGANDI